MKNIKIVTLSVIVGATLFTNGCGGGEDSTTPTIEQKSVTVQNSDGSTFGTTCGDFVSSNGVEGMSLCREGTSNIIGFIRTDATVTGLNGEVIGECSPDFDISQISEVSGNCGLSVSVTNTQNNTPTSSGGGDTTNPTPSSGGGSTSGGGGIVPDGEVTTTTADHPDTPQPTCSNQQPNLLPPCTGAPGEVPLN